VVVLAVVLLEGGIGIAMISVSSVPLLLLEFCKESGSSAPLFVVVLLLLLFTEEKEELGIGVIVGATELDNIDAEGAWVEVGAIVVGPKEGAPASSVEFKLFV